MKRNLFFLLSLVIVCLMICHTGVTTSQAVSVDGKSLSTMFSDSSYKFDKTIALFAAKLSQAAEDETGDGLRGCYGGMGLEEGTDYNVYRYGEDMASSIATVKLSADTNLLIIVGRGSKTLNEFALDYISDAEADFFGNKVHGFPYIFQEKIMMDLNKFLKKHDNLTNGKKLKVFITGHSLGGAAANLVGARFTRFADEGAWWSKVCAKSDIHCYTYGALDSLRDNTTVSNGYENIHNVYNEYDTFGPNRVGLNLRSGMGKGSGKFGHMDLFRHNYEADYGVASWEVNLPNIAIGSNVCQNHIIENYIDALQKGYAMFDCKPKSKTSKSKGWKELYKEKINQIKNEYKSGKRKSSPNYEGYGEDSLFFSLQDINFDGVPELYHTQCNRFEGEYSTERRYEEIYYIKNNKVVRGKIKSNSKRELGLLPPYVKPTGKFTDERWQKVVKNKKTGKISFYTRNADDMGAADYPSNTCLELSFDVKKGVLRTKVIFHQKSDSYKTLKRLKGYKSLGRGTYYSSTHYNPSGDIWKWKTPYVKKKSDGAKKKQNSKQKISVKAKYSYKIADASKTYGENGKYKAKVYFKKAVVTGKSKAVRKINKSIGKECSSFLKSKNTKRLYQYAKEKSTGTDFLEGVEYTYYATSKVIYNKKGIISIKIRTSWNAGGVESTETYGITYNLKNGKKLKLTDVCRGKSGQIKKKILKRVKSKSDAPVNWKELNKLSAEKMQFYLKDNNAVVCVPGQYYDVGQTYSRQYTVKR